MATDIRPLTVSSFFNYHIYHWDKTPTKKELLIAEITSIMLAILFLGIIHGFCYLAFCKRNAAPIKEKNLEIAKTETIVKDTIPASNPNSPANTDLPNDNEPSTIIMIDSSTPLITAIPDNKLIPKTPINFIEPALQRTASSPHLTVKNEDQPKNTGKSEKRKKHKRSFSFHHRSHTAKAEEADKEKSQQKIKKSGKFKKALTRIGDTIGNLLHPHHQKEAFETNK